MDRRAAALNRFATEMAPSAQRIGQDREEQEQERVKFREQFSALVK